MFGINREDFELIKENHDFISRNLGCEPSQLALKGVKPAICTAIKMLQKCRVKLPEYYKACCIIPPISYEQSSSSHTSNTKEYSGKRLLDLTCGLGSDTTLFSKRFDKVITIEREPLLADIARYNFSLLGRDNIQVVCEDSHDYVKNYSGDKFDMIYCDPARRDSKERTFLLEECSPNILSLIDDISNITNRFVVKLSPLFDVSELYNIFNNRGYKISIEIVSVSGECKEVIADISFAKDDKPLLTNTVIDKSGVFKKFHFSRLRTKETNSEALLNPKYIYLPDVVFKKSHNTYDLINTYYPNSRVSIHNNIILSEEVISEFPGRGYSIIEMLDYKPKTLKRYFKEKGIKSTTIIKENTNQDITDIRKQIGLKDGSESKVVITKINENQLLFLVNIII